MSLQKHNFDISDLNDVTDLKVYPFIDELVESMCTPETKSLIKKHIETDSDKQTFLMFIFLYFSIELKLLGISEMEFDDHKKGIKYIMTEIINNPEKRQKCIEVFGKKFNNLFLGN